MPNNDVFLTFFLHILTSLVVHCGGHGKKKKKNYLKSQLNFGNSSLLLLSWGNIYSANQWKSWKLKIRLQSGFNGFFTCFQQDSADFQWEWDEIGLESMAKGTKLESIKLCWNGCNRAGIDGPSSPVPSPKHSPRLLEQLIVIIDSSAKKHRCTSPPVKVKIMEA